MAVLECRRDLVRSDTASFQRLAGLASSRAAVAVGLESLNAQQLQLAWAMARSARTQPVITDLQEGPALTALINTALAWPSGDGFRIQPETIAILPTTASATATPPAWADRPSPTTPEQITVPQNVPTNAAAAAVNQVLTDLGAVVEALAALKPSQLVRGGIGKRDVSTLAARTSAAVPTVVFLLEVARALGIIGVGDSHDDPQWMPTVAWDTFHDDRAAAYVSVVNSWLNLIPNPLHVAAGTTWNDEKVHVLGNHQPPPAPRPVMPFARYRVLTLLSELAPDQQAITTSDLVAHAQFRHPLTRGFDEPTVRQILAEAEHLGLTFTPFHATDACGLTHLGATLAEHVKTHMTAELSPLWFDRDRLATPDDFAQLVTPLLPELERTVITQSDLTAIATGPLHPETATALDQVATVETRGQGTVYRFTPASITRALESGLSTAAILELIERVSSTEVPGPLDFLIRDTATKLGRVTVSAARGVIVVNDPEELDPLIADPLFAAAKLTRVAPTVAISSVGPERLSVLLSTHGIDVMKSSAPAPTRARVPSNTRPVRTRTTRMNDLGAFYDTLMSHPGEPQGAPTTIAGTIRDAIDSRTPLTLTVATATGDRKAVTLTPVAVAGGMVRGRRSSGEVTVPLVRVIAAQPSKEVS